MILSTAMTSLAFLMSAVAYFGYSFIKKRDNFKFPWQYAIGGNGFGTILYRTDKMILFLTAIGGSLELFGA